MDELGLNLKNTPLIVAVSRSLSSPALGTNPLIPSNTNSLSVVCEPNKQNVDSALVRVATVEMSMYDQIFEEECTKKVGSDFVNCVSNLPTPVYNIQMINDLSAKIQSNKENIDEWKDRLKNDKLNVNIKQKIIELNSELKTNKEKFKQIKASYKKETKSYDTKLKNCENISKRGLTNCKKQVLIEKDKYQNTLLEKC